MHSRLGYRQRRPRPQQPIAESLVVALGVVLLEEFSDRPPQHALAEEHHLRRALVLDGLHEPLGDGVHVRCTNGGQHVFAARARQRLAEHLGELRVACDDEEPLAVQKRLRACDLPKACWPSTVPCAT